MDGFAKILHRASSRRCNQLCQILFQSSQGFKFCEGSNFYAWKQLLLSARLSYRNSVCPSVCLSVTRVDQAKTLGARKTL